jgi:hypothetical protein
MTGVLRKIPIKGSTEEGTKKPCADAGLFTSCWNFCSQRGHGPGLSNLSSLGNMNFEHWPVRPLEDSVQTRPSLRKKIIEHRPGQATQREAVQTMANMRTKFIDHV